MKNGNDLTSLSDQELMKRLHALADTSRRVEADLVAHIGEVDARRLWAHEAVSSMFRYCTDRLHLSEDAAYRRIEVARAARQHPMLLDMLRDGRLHLTGLSLLARHLTTQNRDQFLARATHRTRREIERLIAELAPKPDVPATVRKLPERRVARVSAEGTATDSAPVPGSALRAGTGAGSELGPGRVTIGNTPPPIPASAPNVHHQPVVAPLAPDRYRVQFTASSGLRDKLERLQALMRDADPDVDLAVVVEAAVTEKLARLESRRFAKATRPVKTVADSDTAPTSRYVPAAVRRAVYERDGGRCRYVDTRGQRCSERVRLEFHHHDRPFGRGGDHDPGGLRLMCKAHNRLLAERDYGKTLMARHARAPARRC